MTTPKRQSGKRRVKVKAWIDIAPDGLPFVAGLVADMEPLQIMVFRTNPKEAVAKLYLALHKDKQK